MLIDVVLSRILPDGAVVVPLAAGPGGSRRTAARLVDIPAGTTVAVVSGRPGARLQLRTVAAAGGVQVEREMVPVPSGRHPMFLVDDDHASVGWLCRNVLTVPPGSGRMTPLLEVAVRVIRGRAPWQLLGTVAPGRVLIGRRR